MRANVFTQEVVTPLPETATSLPPMNERASDPNASYGVVDLTDNNPFAGVPADSPDQFWSTNGQALLPLSGPSDGSVARKILRGEPSNLLAPPPLIALPSVTKWMTDQEYEGEYWQKAVKDPDTKMWLARRAIALGFAKYDPTSKFLVADSDFIGGGVYQMWKDAGSIVKLNPTLNSMTPEQYLDSLYNRMGGDSAADAAIQASNPIKTNTQVNTYSMSAEQAAAYADQIAADTLGRLPTKAEIAKARRSMNTLMKKNPTVTSTTTDATDSANIKTTQNTKAGVGPEAAAAAYEAKLRRSSEGMAYNVGTLFEQAMSQMDRGL